MAGWTYRCEHCGHQEDLDSRAWRCPRCGGAFGLVGPNTLSPASITNDPSLWRYESILPARKADGRSLGEGMTPLIAGTLADRPVWFKLDNLLPTGSFKDRGAAVFASHLRRLGLRRLIVDSSGNAAAAFAGYCAANDLDCTVYAPATTSPGKLVQSRAFGAHVHLVEGNREAVASAAQNAAEADPTAFYASHNWHAVFVEGVKTWAIEVWEQLGRRVPAAAFVPTGGGSAFVGGRRGFEAIGKLPALVAAQPAACAPVAAAWNASLNEIPAITPGATIAEGTKIGAPARSGQILAALRDSGGWAEAVDDALIEATLCDLFRQGMYVEPTAAVSAATFVSSVKRGAAIPDGDIVILLTGNGLKATDTITSLV
ncbi:MAG TPA: pyridoxal-phosphate dependent enzyme [Thermomicrobiales bacterium]|nr:pyridoxal-phosphate dependent enzyme [Thermomicrobiales bacterium]